MANLRNEFEFRSALLTALGVEHTEAEAKNEETWRSKMLNGLGVEYNQNDVNQFGLFREKLIEGIEGYSGGGGSSDFSTAQVTVVNNDEGSYINMPICLEAYENDPARIGFAYISDYDTETFTVPLYKGVGVAQVTEDVSYSVSGDIEDIGGGLLYITGNGTITLAP